MDETVEQQASPRVVFRPGKKRKIYRQRGEEGNGPFPVSDDPSGATEHLHSAARSASPDEGDGDLKEEGLSVAEVLRFRQARKSKLRGVEFRAEQPAKDPGALLSQHSEEQSLVVRESRGDDDRSSDPIGGVAKRFAPQTGLVGELVNKHMEEYIEAELARRHFAEVAGQAGTQGRAHSGLSGGGSAGRDLPAEAPPPATRGKILEIDLGDEARLRNEAMTERARRRLEGQSVEVEEADPRSKKVRLGRDGKPMRPRNRRGSDDIKRDQLVEEVLHENRLDVYDIPHAPGPGSTEADEEDGAADDRIAEEFRREFMDAMSERRQRRRTTNTANKPTTNREEVLKGPKLGGSRNARAAVRDALLREQQGKGR